MNIFENIRHPTKYLRIIYIFGTLFLGIVYYQRNKGYSVDDSFITYRYAYHLKEGFGLVFNVGERYYGTTAAGYAVILAMLSGVCDLIFQRGRPPAVQSVSVALSALSLAMIAVCLPYVFETGKSASRWLVSSIFAIYLFVGFPFNEVAGHETYTFLAVAFLATVLASNAQAAIAGCTLAIAATFRPDTVLFAPILVFLDWAKSRLGWRNYLTSRNFWRFSTGFLAVIVPWLVYLWVHFGQPTPGTMDAKKAQVALGYWPLYNPLNLFKYVIDTPGAAALSVIGMGLLACIWMAARTRVLSTLLHDRGLFIAIAWLLFGFGSASAYFSFNVTFWRWYGIPVLFSLGVASFVGWRVILDQFTIASKRLAQEKGLADFLRAAPIVVIALLALGASGKFVQWSRSKNINEHIYAYSEIADYLRRVEPDGAVIQMFEPGSFGFRLGPKFTIIDELGLITPGVAKALLRGDSDYAMRTYKPKYLVCSWKGSYSECSKQLINEQYELVGEFNVDFWKPLIGTGARLYQKIQNGMPPKNRTLVRAVSLGDKWGKVDRIAATSEWFIHPGETTDTVLEVQCQSDCSGNYWAHIADLPKEAPHETGNVIVKIVDSRNTVLFQNEVRQGTPMDRVFLRTDSSVVIVYVNNNGSPAYDWLVFGVELPGEK
ncbi:MAG: hypothetical protein MPW14_04375 [Candidatus Manganitrophus sp.]|nr:hypothetical protein [Candidatus Manganitrophus sp.]MDC4223269.1 hypothetical protein [Candidatus Manganitrophus sp.]WDT76121.1 MAG: hypothetical protein MPW16_02585 [Candidatus Manganitrophus sp.]WDT81023.1 MAG: hypothetical protein MPW14_04375 [Candidatus Manganitrophus sp.]